MEIGRLRAQTYYTGSEDIDANNITSYFILGRGINFPTSNDFWFLQTIIFQMGANSIPFRFKQIAYEYDGSRVFERHKSYENDITPWIEYMRTI